MKLNRLVMLAAALGLLTLAACDKQPAPAAETDVVHVASTSPYLGMWADLEDEGRTVEVVQNGAGYIMKYREGINRPQIVIPVTFEADGSMRTSRGTSATIDVNTGRLLFGTVTMKRTR